MFIYILLGVVVVLTVIGQGIMCLKNVYDNL